MTKISAFSLMVAVVLISCTPSFDNVDNLIADLPEGFNCSEQIENARNDNGVISSEARLRKSIELLPYCLQQAVNGDLDSLEVVYNFYETKENELANYYLPSEHLSTFSFNPSSFQSNESFKSLFGISPEEYGKNILYPNLIDTGAAITFPTYGHTLYSSYNDYVFDGKAGIFYEGTIGVPTVSVSPSIEINGVKKIAKDGYRFVLLGVYLDDVNENNTSLSNIELDLVYTNKNIKPLIFVPDCGYENLKGCEVGYTGNLTLSERKTSYVIKAQKLERFDTFGDMNFDDIQPNSQSRFGQELQFFIIEAPEYLSSKVHLRISAFEKKYLYTLYLNSTRAPKFVNQERIYIQSDPNSKYELLFKIRMNGGNWNVTTRRSGASGESYAQREIDCLSGKQRYIGDSSKLSALSDFYATGPMTITVPNSISHEILRYVCGLKRDDGGAISSRFK